MKHTTLVLCLLLLSCERGPLGREVSCADAPIAAGAWYATITPSEAGNSSDRTHTYPAACSALGDHAKPAIAATAANLPGLYNIVTRQPGELFALGGSFGHVSADNAPYVVALEATTLTSRWRTRLPGLDAGEWDYPGVMGVHANGDLYAIYGPNLARLDAATGAVKAHTELPVNQARGDVAYNGFAVLSDGRLVAKSIHRKPGCTEADFMAFLNCETDGMAASTLVLVNADTLAIEQTAITPEHVRFRVTTTRFKDREYVYLPGEERIYRYVYSGGTLALDASWQPSYRATGQTAGTAVAVLGDFVVIQTNGIPAAVPMSIVAVSQHDAGRAFRFTPFQNETPRGSFIPSLPAVDADNRRIYTFDGYAGRLAALDLDAERGLSLAWSVPQRSFAFSALIGPPQARVFVSADMTALLSDYVFPRLSLDIKKFLARKMTPPPEDLVWRDANTGRELGRVADAASVGGSVPAPGFHGNFYVPDLRAQRLVRLSAFETTLP